MTASAHETNEPAPAPERFVGPYWEDPVYRYVSRRHRAAVAAGDAEQADRFDAFMQQLAAAMTDDCHARLADEARADRAARKERRKRRSKPPAHPPPEAAPTVNVADLKRRIFNPSVSRENVIKALEALPPAERKATLATLPPGLRRKLGDYLPPGR